MKQIFKNSQRPRLGVISPMAGPTPGIIPTPAEFLVDHFRLEGYSVKAASAHQNKFARLLDICKTVISGRKNIDILIISVYVGQSFVSEDVASRLAQIFKIPIIMVLHNGLTPGFVTMFPKWSQKVFSRAKILVAPSTFLPRALKPFGWKVQVVPNPINLSLYPFRLRRKVIPRLLWMRSFYPYYNPQMALRVVENLIKGQPDISLIMAGKDKGLQASLEDAVQQLGLHQNICFPGFLNSNEKISTFERTDIFINTNSVDNTPVSILEAWAMGLPVISTAVGGIADLIEAGETGLLVPDDDDQAMAQAVRTLLDEPALAEKLSRQGRERVESFSWEAIRPKWESMFANILNHPHESI